MKEAEPKNSVWASTSPMSPGAVVPGCNMRLAVTTMLAVALDLLIDEAALAVAGHAQVALIAGFSAGAIAICALRPGGFLLWRARAGSSPARFYASFSMSVLFGLLVRSSVLLPLLDRWHWQPQTAIVAAALLGDLVFAVGIFLFVFAGFERAASAVTDWPITAISIVGYTLILKFIFMGSLNLIPEEAYYWNYARHLDIGYLDHPPMVAWLIWLSTSMLGNSEFSVRLPAYLCWIVAAVFMARLSLNLFGKPAAYRTTLLLSVLPIYFGLGFFMTPDAPLFAAWSASLYFLERALVAQDRRAWWRLGLCLGLGMLSKYPAALLGAGILMFLVIDRKSRVWLFRPQPYAGAMIALLLFSPVLLWNMRHGWISFAFQGSGRWSGNHHFALHVLIGSVLLLLTPTGLLGIVRALLPAAVNRATLYGSNEASKRKYFWASAFTIAPLSIFVVYSCINTPKLNWTAPVWLAAVPLMAWDMASPATDRNSLWAKLIRRLWTPTIIALLFIHTGFFNYVSLGLPGAGPMVPERLFGEWRQLADKVGGIRAAIEAKTGSPPILVGMDKNFISSELSFYGAPDAGDPYSTAGAHLFGQRSLMWALWFPRSAAVGKDLLLIDFNRKRLNSPSLARYFDTISDISTEPLKKDGRIVGHFYWRIGHAYHY